MKLSDYFKVIKPNYKCLKIIPFSANRNYNSSDIAKTISTIYKTMNKRIQYDNKHFIIEAHMKICYIIEISKDKIGFYFILPEQYVSILSEKILSVWAKSSIEIVDIPDINVGNIYYQLKYKNLDTFSLNIDRKTNQPIDSILHTKNMFTDTDNVFVIYNFINKSDYGWAVTCDKNIQKLSNNESIKKEIGAGTILFKIIYNTLDFINKVIEGLIDNNKINNEINVFNDLVTTLRNNNKKPSENTKRKKYDSIIGVQILITGNNENVIKTICNTYNCLSDDNELIGEKVFNKINLLDYKYKNVNTNVCSISECQNFIQLPSKELLDINKEVIKSNNVQEFAISKVLTTGYIWCGKTKYNNDIVDCYLSNEKEINNLPLVLLGSMGAGKTHYLGNYANCVINNSNDGLIVIDFIKNCELSEYIESVCPKDRLINIDLSNPNKRQSFCFNEIDITKCKTTNDILEASSLISQEMVRFIDCINTTSDPLSSKMRRYLTSACNIVFTQPNACLKDVVSFLTNQEFRHETIDKLNPQLTTKLQEEIDNAYTLDDGKTGTKDNKIEGVLDRINLLKEDYKLKSMFNMPPENNYNFIDLMDNGCVTLIKMPQSHFKRSHRNILSTFFISKIWLACEQRGARKEELLRNHLIIDEVFDCPTAFNVLNDMLVQVRKFRLKLCFTSHYLNQLNIIKEQLKASGASYMLMQGVDKKNFVELEDELYPFTVNDLLNLKQYHSLNLIKTRNGYEKFVSDLYSKR